VSDQYEPEAGMALLGVELPGASHSDRVSAWIDDQPGVAVKRSAQWAVG
jgi:hypothetical protein